MCSDIRKPLLFNEKASRDQRQEQGLLDDCFVQMPGKCRDRTAPMQPHPPVIVLDQLTGSSLSFA